MSAAANEIDIKWFQQRYGLSNRDMASLCSCSLPTIQKWRSGEVSVSGAARQLMRLLEAQADGNPSALRNLLGRMKHPLVTPPPAAGDDLLELEHSMSKVVDRIELMLESRRKAKELADSEARYESMLEAFGDPVCRWLPDTTLTYVNKAYAAMFSKFGNDLLGRKWLEFIPPEKRPAVATIVSDIIRRGEPDKMVHEVVDKDGFMHIQEWNDIPVTNEKGEVVELHSIGRNTTELVTVRMKLAEAEKMRKAIMDFSEHPILVFDDEGRFLEQNESFQERIVGEQTCTTLQELVTAFPMGKFKRLLKRLGGVDQMHYRLQVGARIYSMNTRLLFEGAEGSRYLGIFKPEVPGRMGIRLMHTRLAHEHVIGGEAQALSLDEKQRKRIEARMDTLGREMQVDRIYVFVYDEADGVFDNVLEWCAEGVESQILSLQRIPINEYKWWNRRIRKDQWIQIEDSRKMPGTASVESEILQAQDIRSVLVAPMKCGGGVVGFIGFDQNRDPRIWHGQEIAALEDLRREMEEILCHVLRSGG